MTKFIVQPGFVQVTRRCAVRQLPEPNHLLWEVLYDNQLTGRISVHGGQVNMAYGKLPAGLGLNQVKAALRDANELQPTN